MIQKINEDKYLDISKLSAGAFGETIAYVYDGKNKTAKNAAPYYLLYLKDIHGSTIPGFVFNVIDYIKNGKTLNTLRGEFISFKYYCDSWSGDGISLQLTNLYLIENRDNTLASKFIGSLLDVDRYCTLLASELSEESGVSIQLPSITLKKSYIDFFDGRVGGLVYHYILTLKQLKTYKIICTEEEYKRIFEAFIVFISCHIDFLGNNCEVDISLMVHMTEKIKYLSDQLNTTSMVDEIVQYFNGYHPKDISVRTVIHHFEAVKKTIKELNLNRTLPLTVCGDAGYGTLKRYV